MYNICSLARIQNEDKDQLKEEQEEEAGETRSNNKPSLLVKF
jgi:hypothetical protein